MLMYTLKSFWKKRWFCPKFNARNIFWKCVFFFIVRCQSADLPVCFIWQRCFFDTDQMTKKFVCFNISILFKSAKIKNWKPRTVRVTVKMAGYLRKQTWTILWFWQLGSMNSIFITRATEYILSLANCSWLYQFAHGA